MFRVCQDPAGIRLMIQGAVDLSSLVSRTYGPNGSTVMIDRAQGILMTKDGYTVLQEAVPFGTGSYATGGKILLDAVAAQNAQAGDGTTLTAILMGKLLKSALKRLAGGSNPTDLTREWSVCLVQTSNRIQSLSRPVVGQEGLRALARSSGYDDKMADLLTRAVIQAGELGHLVVEAGYSAEDSLEPLEGVVIQTRPYDLGRVPEALIAISAQGLVRTQDIQEILEYAGGNKRSVVIFAPFIEGEARACMMMNRKTVDSYGLRAKTNLEDLALATGATVRDMQAGHKQDVFLPEWFGGAANVAIEHSRMVLMPYPEYQESLGERARVLLDRAQTLEFPFDRDQMRRRASSLVSSVVAIRMAAQTDAEARERKGRLEDALKSIQSGLRYGVVEGAAAVLNQVAVTGVVEFDHMLKKPQEILKHSGVCGSGVDSVEVVLNALKTAVQNASQLILCGAVMIKT